jgi:MFS family permease
MIADAAPEDLRGTAYGFFNLVAGVATLLASVVAGAFWETLGASVTFLAGGAFAAIALVGLLVLRPGRR